MGKRKNSTKAERTALLKKLGYTEADMQKFWDESKEVNWKIKMLANSGLNWTDLCIWQIEQLPTLKEKTLEQKAKKEEIEKQLKETRAKEQADKEYYEAHFEEIILDKISKNEDLTKEELKTLVFEYEYERKESPDVYKNIRTVETIVNLKGKFFCIKWNEDLGDWGEHQFNYQPYEVKKVEKVVKVSEWLSIEKAKEFKDKQESTFDYNTITDKCIDAITEFMHCNYVNCGMENIGLDELKKIQDFIKRNIRG